MDYLEKWGKTFWEETDYRIRELTTKLETDLKLSIDAAKIGIPISADGGKSLTAEQKAEVVHRAQHVVNEVQIRQLSDMIELVDEVLEDPKRCYYIVIDRPDEDWGRGWAALSAHSGAHRDGPRLCEGKAGKNHHRAAI